MVVNKRAKMWTLWSRRFWLSLVHETRVVSGEPSMTQSINRSSVLRAWTTFGVTITFGMTSSTSI